MFYGLKQDYNINKSKKALEDALRYLKNDWNQKWYLEMNFLYVYHSLFNN